MPLRRAEDFYTFCPKITSPFGGGHEIYNLHYCILTLQMLHTKFGLDWLRSSSEEDVNARRTTVDDGRQPIAIGHLSYSGDLKISSMFTQHCFTCIDRSDE